MPINYKAVLAANIAAFAALLADEGIHLAHVTYVASGDEGDPYDVAFHSADGMTADDPETEVDLQIISRAFVDGAWVEKVEVVSHEAVDAMETICDSLITVSGCDGYENDEGGCGEITVRADGTFVFEHSDYVTTSEVRVTWTEDDLTPSVPEAPLAIAAA